MTYLIYILAFTTVFLPIISFFLGCFFLKYKFVKELNKGTGKLGIIIESDYTKSYYTEVEELGSAGDRTKVRILNTEYDKYKKGEIKWIETNKIVWYNDNTQRLREEKLEKILGE